MSAEMPSAILRDVADNSANVVGRKVLRPSAFRWADISRAPLHDFPIRDEMLCQYFQFSSEMKVLEIGPGCGFTASWLAPLAEMTIEDVMPEVIADLRDQLQSIPSLHFGLANLARNEVTSRMEQRFDVVFALDVFEYVPEPASALINLYERLAIDGQLFLTFPNVAPPKGDGITFFASRRELECLLEAAGFRYWLVSSIRETSFARFTYTLLHEWPIRFVRSVWKNGREGRPQTYENTWAFKKRASLNRLKPFLHLYWIALEQVMHLAGPIFETEARADDLLDRQLIVRAWK